jgi:hypothetical protein
MWNPIGGGGGTEGVREAPLGPEESIHNDTYSWGSESGGINRICARSVRPEEWINRA